MNETLRQVLIVFGIVGGLGLILGIGLVVAAKFLYVEEDTRIEDITKLLPGANCGSCGNPGCAGFATLIVEGKAEKLSVCKPGKPDKNFQPIIDYLEKHPNPDGTVIKVKI